MDTSLLGPLLLFSVFIIFFMVLPQRKKIKKEKEFYGSLKKGMKVITGEGMHGKVLELNDDGTFILETGAGKIKFDKTAISVEKSNKLNEVKK